MRQYIIIRDETGNILFFLFVGGGECHITCYDAFVNFFYYGSFTSIGIVTVGLMTYLFNFFFYSNTFVNINK